MGHTAWGAQNLESGPEGPLGFYRFILLMPLEFSGNKERPFNCATLTSSLLIPTLFQSISMSRAIPHWKFHPEPLQKSGRGSINLLLYLGTVLGKLGPSCQPQENLLSRLGPGKWGASNFLGPNLPWRKSRISSPGKFGPGAQFATQGLDWTLKANHCCNVNGVFVRLQQKFQVETFNTCADAKIFLSHQMASAT